MDDSGELLKRVILAGLGIGFPPYINVVEDERAGRVVAVRMEGRRFARDLARIFRKENILTRGSRIFLEIAIGGGYSISPFAVESVIVNGAGGVVKNPDNFRGIGGLLDSSPPLSSE